MKIFLSIILTFHSFNILAQTCILVVRTKDSLFVGADTRVGNINSIRYDTVCKIIKQGKYFFTFAGYSFENSLIDMNKYFQNDKDLKTLSSHFLSSRYVKLKNKLMSIYTEHLDYYIRHFKKMKWTEAIFFGIENDQIVSRQVYFEIVSDSNQAPIIDTGNINMEFLPNQQILVHPAGHYNSIDSLFYQPATWKNGIGKGIEDLIAIQSKTTPESVSLPIDIILLTSKGEKWFSAFGKCHLHSE